MADKLQIMAPDGTLSWQDIDRTKDAVTLELSVANNDETSLQITIDFPESPDQARVRFRRSQTYILDDQESSGRILTISYGQALVVAGYTLIFHEGVGEEAPEFYLPNPMDKIPEPAPALQQADKPTAETLGAALQAVQQPVEAPRPPAEPPKPRFTLREAVPLDLINSSNNFRARLSSKYWSTEVENVISCRVDIYNTSKQTASFDVDVYGLTPEDDPRLVENDIAGWNIDVNPPSVNLNAGDKPGEITVTIRAPRAPASAAGKHPLVFMVTSEQFPECYIQLGAMVEIKPYYEFTVEKLTPSYETVKLFNDRKKARFSIVNKGNSKANYKLQSTDDESDTLIRFPQKGGAAFTREIEIEPGKTEDGNSQEVEIAIKPRRRPPLIAAGSKEFKYTITTISKDLPKDSPFASQEVKGRVGAEPLLAPIVLQIMRAFFFLCLFLLALYGLWKLFWFLQPQIISFDAENKVIRQGEAAKLNWDVSNMTANLKIDGVPDAIAGSQRSISYTPTTTLSTFTLVASSWLSRLLGVEIRAQPVSVVSIPVYPEIVTLSVDRNRVYVGDTITVKWSAGNAEEAWLTVEGVTTTLKDEKLNGEQQYQLKGDTLVVFTAKNSSGTVTRSELVKAEPISVTVKEFNVTPDGTITKGSAVLVKWEVISNLAKTVTIAPWKDPLPLKGELSFYPEASMEFILTAKAGEETVVKVETVGVVDKPDMKAPVIDIFKVAPENLPVGGGNVEFSWSVSGADRIQIVGKSGIVADNLAAKGFLTTNVTETSNFLMVAYTAYASAPNVSTSKDAKVTVAQAKKKVVLRIDKVAPGTGAAIQKFGVIDVYVKIGADNGSGVLTAPSTLGLPEITGIIKVSDGLNDCSITLPSTLHCMITVNQLPNITSSSNLKGGASRNAAANPPTIFTASYTGDTVYDAAISVDYSVQYTYQTNPVDITATISPAVSSTTPTVYTGNSFTLSVDVKPTNPNATRPVTGKLSVELEDQKLCDDIELSLKTGSSIIGTGKCPTLILPLVGMAADADVPLKLTYQGNDDYSAYPVAYIIHVNKAVTQITTSTTSQTGMYGDVIEINFAVSVEPGKGGGIPTGKVRVSDAMNPSSYCEQTLSVTGVGSCNFPLRDLGSRQLIFTYTSDDGRYANFTSSTVTPLLAITTTAASTDTRITSVTPTYATFGYEVGLKATVHFTVASTNPAADANLRLPSSGTVTISLQNIPATTPVQTCQAAVLNGEGQCDVLLDKATSANFIAQYTPDPDKPYFTNSQSPTQDPIGAITVNKAPTQITFTTFSVPSPVEPGTSITFGYQVTAARSESIITGPDAGTVTVAVINGQTLCANQAYPNVIACTSTALTQEGLSQIQATYSGSANFIDSFTSPTDYTVRQGTTIAVSAQPPSSLIDGAVTFAAVVSSSGMSGSLSGTISVSANTGESCPDRVITPPTTSYTDCVITFTTAGPRTVTATYTPDTASTYSASSGGISYTASKVTPSFQDFSIAPAAPEAGQNATASIVLNFAPATTAPTGTVDILLGATTLCTVTLTSNSNGAGNCVLSFSQAGPQSIIAQYSEGMGGTRFNSVSSLPLMVTPVATGTSVALSIPPGIVIGQEVDLTATVNSSGNIKPTGSVQFTLIHMGASTPACTSTLNNQQQASCNNVIFTNTGAWTVQADYIPSDATLFNATSASSNVTVGMANTKTTIEVVSAPASPAYGDTIIYRATVAADPAGSMTPAGTVSFSFTLGGTTETPALCTNVALANGQAVCSYQYMSVGSWTVSAQYPQTTEFNTSSKTLAQTINARGTTTSLNLSASTVSLGDTISINVAVENNPTLTGFTPNGNVEVSFSGGSMICTIILANGVGSCVSDPLTSVGDFSIKADYKPADGNYQTSSKTAALSVQKIVTSLGVAITPATIKAGDTGQVAFTVTPARAFATGLTGKVTLTVKAPDNTTTTPECTLVAGQCTIPVVFNQKGIWSLSATYSGDTNYKSSTWSGNQTVDGNPSTTTILSMTKTGKDLEVSVKVDGTSPDGSTPGGKVTVSVSGKSLTCEVTLSSGSGKCTLNNFFDLAANTYTIVADYKGDKYFAISSDTDTQAVPVP